MKEVELSARSANSAGTQNSPREASTAPEHPPINYSATQAYTLLLKAKQDELPESMARTLNKLSSTLNAPPKETAQPQAGQPFGNICSMRRNFACDDSLTHVVKVRKAQMLRRRDVTEEVRAVGCGNGAADGGGDVVVSRRDIRNERTKDIQRRIVAEPFFQRHIGGNFVHCHVAGTFHHDLYVVLPCAFC